MSRRPRTGAFDEVERYLFDLRGYVVRDGVLGARELAELHGAVAALELPPPGATVASQRFQHHLGTHPAFRRLIDHPAVLDVVRELVGPHVRLDHAYGIVMARGTGGLGLHGGGTPFDPAQWYLWRDGAMSNGLVAVQWALVDHRPGDGGFACIPGSHKAHLPLPAGRAPEGAVVEVPMTAGSLVVFTEALTHATLPWRGAGTRLTLLYKYAPGHLAWARRPPLEEHPGLADHLTPRLRRLVDPPSVAGREPP